MIEVIIKDIDLIEKIKRSEAKDNEVIKILKEIRWAEMKKLKDNEWR